MIIAITVTIVVIVLLVIRTIFLHRKLSKLENIIKDVFEEERLEEKMKEWESK